MGLGLWGGEKGVGTMQCSNFKDIKITVYYQSTNVQAGFVLGSSSSSFFFPICFFF